MTKSPQTIQAIEIGIQAERCAKQFLTEQGYECIAENYHSRYGEIDLIVKKDNLLAFIEVKFRKNNRFGEAVEMVTLSKQQKIIQTAEFFLLNFPEYQYFDCRFDVIGITKELNNINWLQNAFDVF